MRTTNTNQNPRPRCLPQALHRANRRSHQTRPNRRRDGTKAHHDRKRLLHGAVLLQIAHPGVDRGVARHSNFSHQLVEHNGNTAIFMYTIGWGSPEEKAAVDRAHVPINGNADVRRVRHEAAALGRGDHLTG
ncbi:hypothetical protein V2W45_1428179 [Cenococcum geophilum]